MLVMLMAQPRIFMNMSKDRLLPPVFGKIHKRFRTPAITTVIVGVICMVAAALTPISRLAELVNIGTLLAFCIVCIGVILMRRQMPNIPRPFKTPLVPLVPILGVAACLAIMLGLSWVTFAVCGAWIAVGLVIYYLYGAKRQPMASLTPEQEAYDKLVDDVEKPHGMMQ
jgi:APA family basic amino acid/polyamine antiporter